MKPSAPSPWNQLLASARQDQPPPVDLAALLRVVRQERTPGAPGFAEMFAGWFATPRAWGAYAATGSLCVALGAWQGWSAWQQLSVWLALFSDTLGGLT